MLRPLVFIDQEDRETFNRDHEFLLGDHVLVSPVIEDKERVKKVYLPKGEWYNLWTNQLYHGRKEHLIEAKLDQMPIFIKAGAIIPKYPVQQYVGEKVIDTISLDIYFKNGVECSYNYDDDKNGYGYENGEFKFSRFQLEGTDSYLKIEQSSEGSYQSEVENYKLNFLGFSSNIKHIVVDGFILETDALVSSDFKELTVVFD